MSKGLQRSIQWFGDVWQFNVSEIERFLQITLCWVPATFPGMAEMWDSCTKSDSKYLSFKVTALARCTGYICLFLCFSKCKWSRWQFTSSGRWGIAPTHSGPLHYMGLSDQRHAPAALLPGERTPVPIAQEAGWTPETVWIQRLQEKSFRLCRGSNVDRPVVQPVTGHYTDWATRLTNDICAVRIMGKDKLT
jgi:hypothetical protein